MRDDLRQLPKVQTLLESASAEDLIAVFGRNSVADAVRAKIDHARAIILADSPMPDGIRSEALFWKDVSASLSQSRKGSLKRVINASGVIIHTNLGRAPLAPEAIAAIEAVAASYSTLEFDIDSGKRGSRHQHAQKLICELTGAEAAIVVNNCAGAILTVLSALANKKEVIASRGELVEIGGSFRMPDVINQSGAQLREVGTTNKTHRHDYESAISDDTALLLRSHTSNFAVVGFTSSPDRKDLAKLACANALPLVEDLGSGVLVDLAPYGLPDEPRVKDVLRAGVDVVTFSGDKLLGGPQAGIIAGRKDLIDQIKAHPMARAVRIDKLSLAALIATLELYREPNNPMERVPVLRALAEPIDLVYARAKQLADGLEAQSGIGTIILSSKARAGGGSLPQQDLPSFAVALEADELSPNDIAERFRNGLMPVIGRITKDQFLLDARTITDAETAGIIEAAGTTFSE